MDELKKLEQDINNIKVEKVEQPEKVREQKEQPGKTFIAFKKTLKEFCKKYRAKNFQIAYDYEKIVGVSKHKFEEVIAVFRTNGVKIYDRILKRKLQTYYHKTPFEKYIDNKEKLSD